MNALTQACVIMCAINVVRHLALHATWKYIALFIQVTNHLSVALVGRHSQEKLRSEIMNALILVKNPISVSSVVLRSASVAICSLTSEQLITRISAISARIVARASSDGDCWITMSRLLTLGNVLTSVPPVMLHLCTRSTSRSIAVYTQVTHTALINRGERSNVYVTHVCRLLWSIET